MSRPYECEACGRPSINIKTLPVCGECHKSVAASRMVENASRESVVMALIGASSIDANGSDEAPCPT